MRPATQGASEAPKSEDDLPQKSSGRAPSAGPAKSAPLTSGRATYRGVGISIDGRVMGGLTQRAGDMSVGRGCACREIVW